MHFAFRSRHKAVNLLFLDFVFYEHMLISMIFHDSLICLPVTENAGIESRLSTHFRSADYHCLYDTVSGTYQVMKQSSFERGGCQLVDRLVRSRVASVLVQDIGRNAYLNLMEQGVSVWITKAQTVAGALKAWRAGLLVPLFESQLIDHMQYCKKRELFAKQ